MAQIIAATERNERFQAGPEGQRLLQLTTIAKSNLNIDLSNLDAEIQRQFGLYSVEVTGDGVREFRYFDDLVLFSFFISLGMRLPSHSHFR